MTGLNIDNHERKKALLLYYAGENFHDMFETLTLPEDGDNVYQKSVTALNTHMEPSKNTDKHEAEFRKIVQLPGECIDSFYTRLMQKAQFCDFHDDNKEVRLQLIAGTTSSHVQYKGTKYSREKMPLEDLMSEARAHELAQAEGEQFRQNSQEQKTVNYVKPDKPQTQKLSKNSHKSCWFCGGSYPHTGKCPAEGKTCRHCKKTGHFEQVCHSKQGRNNRTHKKTPKLFHKKGKWKNVHSLGQNASDSDGEVFALNGSQGPPKCDIMIGDQSVKMVIDSGCPKNLITKTVLRNFTRQPKLMNTNVKLYPYMSKIPLPIRSKFKSRISCGDRTVTDDVFIVESDSASSLLCGSTARDLGLLDITSQICNVESGTKATQPVKNFDAIVQEFPDIFKGIGKLKDYQVTLHTNPDAIPVAQSHRRVPYSLRTKIANKIKELEDADIIEEVDGPTPWVSPIVCVPKPNNPSDIRMCVDMRSANKGILRERHITPTMSEIIADVNGSTVFSKLDLNQGYHQLELDPESRSLTTFSTHLGLRRYKRLNFGISCASEIFQNAISQALQGIQGVLNVSDDIMVFSKSPEEHAATLRSVLQRLQDKGLTLNKKKCEVGKSEMSFFGFVFSARGIKPDPKKIQSIQEAKRPTSVTEVRSFMGMITYVGRFIPGMATIAAPLRLLTHKNQRWQWSAKEESAFQKLKECLANTHVMAYFDSQKSTKLVVDASPVGLAGMLMQDGRVISYASRALSDVESRYSQTEREALAIAWSCSYFRLYIYGRPVEVITDHRPLVPIFNNPQSKLPPCIERWLMKLQDYNITVKYAPGSTNPADYMSRHPVDSSNQSHKDEAFTESHVNFVTQLSVPKAITREQLANATNNDRTLQSVIHALQTGNWFQVIGDDPLAKVFFNLKSELSVSDDGILLRGTRVIPESLQKHCVKLAHSGHQGIVKTKNLVRSKIWFSGLDKMVETKIKNCVYCQMFVKPQREPLQMTEIPKNKWEKLSMDFCGPLSSGEYLMVVIDDHSRYPEVEVVHSTAAKAVLPKLKKILAAHGNPLEIKTDNGPPFNGIEFSAYLESEGIHHRKITPLWPEANGEVERFMRTLSKVIRVPNNGWKSEMFTFLKAYRATPHSSTGVSPSMALNNRELNIGFPNVEPPKKLEDIVRSKVIKNDKIVKNSMQKYADAKRNTGTDRSIDIGDSVLVRNTNKHKTDLPFHQERHTVVQKKGSMITATNGNSNVTRNSSHFLKLPEEVGPPVVEQQPILQPPLTPQPPGLSECTATCATPQEPSTSVQIASPAIANRPQRERRMPARLLEYELKKH